MVIILGVSLVWFNRRKNQVYMPAKPDTIVGCIYYLCESRMMKDFEGLISMDAKARDKIVNEMDRRYVFGDLTGDVARVRRVGVEYCLSAEEQVAGS